MAIVLRPSQGILAADEEYCCHVHLKLTPYVGPFGDLNFLLYPTLKRLDATTIERLNNGFYNSCDELCAVLFDRPSEAIIGYPHSYDEGSSSHSEAPQVFNIPQLKNDVSNDISEYLKYPFVDSTTSPLQREEIRKKKLGSSSLHLKALEGASYGSNGLHGYGINSPPGQYVFNDNTPYVVNQQWEEYKGGELDRKKRDHIIDGLNEIHSYGINSPMEQYVSIDIPCVVNQQWKEYIGGELERNKRDYSKIIESTLAITGQAVGTLLSRAFSGSFPTSWTENFVAVATVFGIAFTLSGIGLSRVNPRLSGIAIKLGAVATASAIILALGWTVVPAVAWTAGAVACFLIAIGVVMA